MMQPGQRKTLQQPIQGPVRTAFGQGRGMDWADGAVQTLFGQGGASAGQTLFGGGGRDGGKEAPALATLATDNLLIGVKIRETRSLGDPEHLKKLLLSYFKDFHYEVLSDWSGNARPIDPASVNWKAIASGKQAPTMLVRQLPGPWNSMGAMKFEMPNDYGIYLHDTPVKELFAKQDRCISNGCVRLEDYRRFATWVFGRAPEPMRPLLGAPIDPARFHYFGIRIGDDGDWALQRELDLKLLDPEVPINGPVHIHFDLDVLDPHEFPYVAYPEGGLGIKEAIDLVSRIAREADVVGLTVTEFAPSNEEEARAGSKVIARLCEAIPSYKDTRLALRCRQ